MISKKIIGIFVVALLVLSVFTSIAMGSNGHGKRGKGTGFGVASAQIAASQPVEDTDTSRRYNLGSINSCEDIKLKRGDTVRFTIDDKQYAIRQGIVGSRFLQLTLNPSRLSTRLYEGGYQRYDLDNDNLDDLQVAAYELVNGKAYLAICHLE